MKVATGLIVAPMLAVHASQLPLHALVSEDGTKVVAQDVLDYLNKINTDTGVLLGADRNNVTIHLGDQHVSYQGGRLYLRNSTESRPDTAWQIRYGGQTQTNAEICAHVPSVTTRCWDAGSGSATIGGSRSARYLPTTVGGKFVFWENSYCLSVADNQVDLVWAYNSECTHFTVQPSRATYSSPRGLQLGANGASVRQFGAGEGESIDDLVEILWQNPFVALCGAATKTIGSAINLVAPNSQAARNARQAGDAWGYCGPSQPC